MKFPHFFIERPIFAAVLSILIVIVGAIAGLAGGVIVGGTFDGVRVGADPTYHARANLLRLNPDYSLDLGWSLGTFGDVLGIDVAQDPAGDRLYIGGRFNAVNGATPRARLAMIDLDDIAIARFPADEADRSARGGIDRGAMGTAEIESWVKVTATRERIGAEAKAGRDIFKAGRQRLRQAGDRAFQRVHPRETKAKALKAGIDRTVSSGCQH